MLPVLSYAFDEGAGNTTTPHQGTAAATGTGVQWTTGPHATPAVASLVQATSGLPDPTSWTGFTLSAWCRPGTAGNVFPVSCYDSAGDWAGIEFRAGGARIVGWLGDTILPEGPTSIPGGTWRHAAITWDGTTLRSYVDGTLQQEAAATAPRAFTRLMVAGADWSLNGGALDDLRIYDRAQTAAEITADMGRPVTDDVAPDDPPATGTATGAHHWSGQASAGTSHRGTASGAHAWSGAATGRAGHRAAATAAHTWTGVAHARQEARATAIAAHGWQGAATAARVAKATAAGGHAWTGEAAGHAPPVDSSTATATGTHHWAGTAQAARPSHATADGGHTWQGAAVAAHPRGPGRNITITVAGVVAAPLTVKPPMHPLTVASPVRVLGRHVTAPTGNPTATTGPTPEPVTITPPRPAPLAATPPTTRPLAVTAPRS